MLINFLRELKGATPATIVMETRPKMNKFGRTPDENNEKVPNPFLDRIVKRTRMNVFLNTDYENSVNRQLSRENKDADFDAQQRAWGEHITKSLIFHEGHYYLQVKVEKTYSAEYIDTRNGSTISIEDLREFMPPIHHSQTQGTDKEIKVISIKVENLISMGAKGEQYEIERF